MSYLSKEIWVPMGSEKLYTLCYVPEGTGPFPTIFLAHGFAGSYHDNLNCAERYANAGFAACSLEFRGATPQSRSGGLTTEMSPITQVDDMEAVVHALMQEDFVDRKNLFFWGESQGGLVAALCGARMRETARGLILLYPAFNIPKDGIAKFGTYENITERTFWNIPLGKKFYQDIWYLDSWKEAAKYEGPVAIFHGTVDKIVPYASSELAVRTYRNASLTAVKEAGHGFYNETGEDVDREVIRFVKEHTS